MKFINSQNIRLVVMIFFIVFLYAFTNKRNGTRRVQKIHVEFQGTSKVFLTHQMVNNLLIQNLKTTSTLQKDGVDLKKLENTLLQNDFIEQVDVFSSEDGMLMAKIKQKAPIARIINNNQQKYIDKNGTIFNVSPNYSARVPIVYGTLKSSLINDYVKTFKYIDEDDFLKKNIVSIELLKNGTMKMKTRMHDYDLLFGLPIHTEKKFKNYKAFFQYAIRDSLINSYKSINLIFTQQVVGTK